MSDLSSLVVRLEAQTSQYTAAIQKATEDIGGFADKVGDSIADVAKDLLGLEALKEAFDFTENIVKSIASFDQLSHSVGVSTEALSQLSFAGKLSGVDDISAALEHLARSAGQVQQGNEKMQGTYAALGLSITDSSGRLKSSEQLFLDVADAVAKYNDGLTKTAAVQQILGRSSAADIKFLDQGSAAIKAAQQEAIDLGVSISSPAAKAADEFESNMVRIGAAIEGIFYKTLQQVLPEFQKLTDEVVDFAKNANNTQPIIDQLVAGFKVIASALIIVGTGFEVVGKNIAGIITLIGFQIEALKDLAIAFASPLEAAKSFIATEKQAYLALNDITTDIGGTMGAGVKAVTTLWSGLDDELNEIHVTAKKIKPDLVLPDQTMVNAIKAAIEALAKLDDSLKQQVATYGLSGAAATAYDVTLGNLSASVALLDNKKPSQVNSALEQLNKQGKISKEVFDEVAAAIQSGVPPGEALKAAILGEADALDKLKGVDALSKLDSQLLTMTGHLQEAAKAAFDLANRPLQITIQTAQDKTQFSGLDGSQKQIEVTTQINALKQQAIDIEDALGKKIADVDAAAAASGKGVIQTAGEEAAARQAAISQLETLYVKAQALAESTGLPTAAKQALALRDAIGAIQFNPKILSDIDKATQEQQKLNEAVEKQKDAAADVALATATLDKEHAQGALTDLDFMAKQDEERQKQIADLEVLYQAQLKYANEVKDPKAIAAYEQTEIAIQNLQAQMGQLAKTIRTDLTDDATNAFTDFATGAKSASDALKEFVQDFTKQMIQLGAKQLFQKLFDTTGITGGINSIFGPATSNFGVSNAVIAGVEQNGGRGGGIGNIVGSLDDTSAASGLGGSQAAAAAISTALTSGAGTLGTALETSGGAAGDAMGAAISAAGDEAAAAMAEAIGGASAGSDAGDAALAVDAIGAAAGGGPIPANQLTLVGENGPELYVSDLGEQSAAAATHFGTMIPDDLSHAHIIGAGGPELIMPNVSGFIVPSDAFLTALNERIAPQVPQSAIFGPGVKADPETPDSERLSSPQVPSLRQFAPGVDMVSLAMMAPAKIEAFATGGSFTGGAPILVGENGPELIVPDVSGTVIPNNVIAQYIPQLSAVLDVTQPPQSPQAPLDPIPTYPTTTVNGAEVPLGLTDTFTTDAQGFTTINENVAGYAGMALPAGTVTASGATTLATGDLTFVTVSQLAESYEPDYLSQKYANTTMASYDAQFGATPSTSTTPIRLGPGVLGGTSTAINYAAELQSYANQKLSGNEAALPLAAYAGVGPVPASSSLIGTEAAAVQPNLLDARQYERLITDGYLEKRASGGPVSANTPYLVGENGPELMVPDSDGTVMNSWDDSKISRSTVVNNHNNFVIQAPSGKVDRASQGQIAARVGMASQAALGRYG